ncbi:YkyA family protein [Lentibacillus sediminis]|uniref:YkyA family protein n=1 Tax=Lentibacillus sediminis TaxID=1940529 RepID=UPI000C1C554C|nr:YkyA family protein [Lentibacillus sediminis]
MPLRKGLLLLGVCLIAVLAACSGESAEEQIHNHLEEAVALEEDFENQQSAITELEQQEQEIYSQITDLGMDELDEIQQLSQQAIDVINERAEKIEVEKESITASEEEFNKISDLIPELENEDVRAKAEEMQEVMANRYNAYDTLYEAYTESMELEKELYTMLQQEELEQAAVTEQINQINESYQAVLDANEQFNNLTVEYNALKQEFYELAELNVEYEENTESEAGESEDSESE